MAERIFVGPQARRYPPVCRSNDADFLSEKKEVPFIPVEAQLFLYQNDWGRFTDLQVGFFQLAPSPPFKETTYVV